MALSNEDKKDVEQHMGKKMANKVSRVTNDSIKKSMARKMKRTSQKENSSYGVPSGHHADKKLRKRFHNFYAKENKAGKLGYLDKREGGRLLKQNSFYDFNKPEYD